MPGLHVHDPATASFPVTADDDAVTAADAPGGVNGAAGARGSAIVCS